MSKLKIGDKVIVKATNEKGIIKGRDIVHKDNGTFDVQYIVKLKDGFENWKPFTKRELQRISFAKPDKKKHISHITVNAEGGYKVTVASVYVKKNYGSDVHNLQIGYAICNPNDTFNEKFGIKLAVHRAENNSFSTYASLKRNDFTQETAEAIIKIKADYIAKNISDFVYKP